MPLAQETRRKLHKYEKILNLDGKHANVHIYTHTYTHNVQRNEDDIVFLINDANQKIVEQFKHRK